MNTLVFNCGSSSLKYKWIHLPSERLLAGGEAQRIGPRTAEPPRILHRRDGAETVHFCDMPDHATAFERVMELLEREGLGAPDAMGHRVVHGGAIFENAAVMDAPAIERLRSLNGLAPLHNPPAVALLDACRALRPGIPQVAVFDTAYHSTIPPSARLYALPGDVTERIGLRKYGFHGTSHRYVAQEAARFLGKPLERLNAVSCHLGSGGASLCAIVEGRSVDNTMGFSPLQGLVMSTRCGDLDPALALRLLARYNADSSKVEAALNKRSGVLGLSGVSADIRDVFARLGEPDHENPRLDLTAQVYLWRIRKYLGAYLTVAAQADAVIFTDTIGELSPEAREAICAGLGWFGLRLDRERNASPGPLPADVAAPDSRVRALVIETNEELAIARVVAETLESSTRPAASRRPSEEVTL